MYIIDRHTDFYDHFSHIYGLDKSIIFDRRGSTRLTDDMLVDLVLPQRNRNYETQGFVLLEIGDVQYIVHIYDIVYGSLHLDSYEVELLHTYEEHRHLNDSALVSVQGIRLFSRYFGNFGRIPKKMTDLEIPSLDEVHRRCSNSARYHSTARQQPTQKVIELPIIANTKLTSVLDAEKIWRDLQNYISSLDNDVDVSIPMTDKDKAATHGFDKHSFRHPVK